MTYDDPETGEKKKVEDEDLDVGSLLKSGQRRPTPVPALCLALLMMLLLSDPVKAPYEILEGYTPYQQVDYSPILESIQSRENLSSFLIRLGAVMVSFLGSAVTYGIGGIEECSPMLFLPSIQDVIDINIVETGGLRIPCGDLDTCSKIETHIPSAYEAFLREAAPRRYIQRREGRLSVHASRDSISRAWAGSGSVVPYLWFTGHLREGVQLEEVMYEDVSLEHCGGDDDKLWCLAMQLGNYTIKATDGCIEMMSDDDAWIKRCPNKLELPITSSSKLELRSGSPLNTCSSMWIASIVILMIVANVTVLNTKPGGGRRSCAGVLYPKASLPWYWFLTESRLNGQMTMILALIASGTASVPNIAATLFGTAANVLETMVLMSCCRLFVLKTTVLGQTVVFTKNRILMIIMAMIIFRGSSKHYSLPKNLDAKLAANVDHNFWRGGVHEDWAFGLPQRLPPSDFEDKALCYDLQNKKMKRTLIVPHYAQLWPPQPREASLTNGTMPLESVWGGLLQASYNYETIPTAPTVICSVLMNADQASPGQEKPLLETYDSSHLLVKDSPHGVQDARKAVNIIHGLSTGEKIVIRSSPMAECCSIVVVIVVVVGIWIFGGITIPIPVNHRQGSLINGWKSGYESYLLVAFEEGGYHYEAANEAAPREPALSSPGSVSEVQ